MYPTRDSTTSNNGWLWCLSIFISQHLIAASRPDLTLKEPSGNDIQQGDLKATREEPSHQASLMAGNRTPGPSDVPCLVETSTAHGELLLWITPSSIASNKLSWSSSYVLNLFQKPLLPSPELSASLQISHPPPYGRRSAIYDMPTKEKLGFPLVGSSKNGPITLLKPKSKRCNPKQILSKPRYVPNVSLSIFSHMLRRLWKKIDRRHQSNRNLPLLSWMFKKSMRTLPLDSPRSISYESKRLKKNDLRLTISRISWSYKEDFENLKRNLNPLSPSSFVERTFSSPSSFVERTFLSPSSFVERTFSSPSSFVERTFSSSSSFMERTSSPFSMEKTISTIFSFVENVFISSTLMELRAQVVHPPSLAEEPLNTIFNTIKSEVFSTKSTRDFISILYIYVSLIRNVVKENVLSSLAKSLLMLCMFPN